MTGVQTCALPISVPQLVNVDDYPPVRVNLPFTFCFYGQQYNYVHITANGTLSLATFNQVNTGFNAAGFPLASTAFQDNRLIAPFWADVDFGGANNTGTLNYELTNTHLIVTWTNVGYYSGHHDKKNTFQVIITNGLDQIISNGNNVRFNYGDMQWTTGDASPFGNIGGFGGNPANVGINKGDGTNFIQIGRFDNNSDNYDGPFGLVDGVSFLDNKTFDFNTCPPNSSDNIPPVAIRETNCDTVYVCNNDTTFFKYEFIAPENGQVCKTFFQQINIGTSQFVITRQDTALRAFIQGYVIGRGAPDTLVVRFGAVDTLTGSSTFIGDTSYFNLVIVVAQPVIPTIVGPKILCFGQPITLTTDRAYDEYLWSPNGQTSQSITVSTPGTYRVKIIEKACEATSAVYVVGAANAQRANILGDSSYCFTDSTLLAAQNPAALKEISWNSIYNGQRIITAGAGQYILSVVDTNGCASSDTLIVKGGGVKVKINDLKPFCKGEAIELFATPNATINLDSFIWKFNNTIVSDTDTVSISQTGQLILTLVDNGCSSYDTVNAVAAEIPNISFTTKPDQYTFKGKEILATSTAQVTTLPIVTYTWAVNNNAVAQNSEATLNNFPTPGNYTITHTVTDQAGCSATLDKIVYVIDQPTNVITPNNDLVNDNFIIPFAKSIKGTQLQIFNRWGNVVYTQNDYQDNWDASNLSEGVYFYVFSLPDGQSYKGSVSIIK